MAEDQAQRTEPATPKKREEARNKGQVSHGCLLLEVRRLRP